PAADRGARRIRLGRIHRHHAEPRAALRAARRECVLPAGARGPRHGDLGRRRAHRQRSHRRHGRTLRPVRAHPASQFSGRHVSAAPGAGAGDALVPHPGPAVTTAPFEPGLWVSALPFLLTAAAFTWLVTLPLRDVSLADSLWSLLLFAAAVIYALDSDPRGPRLSLVLWLVAIWAARLAIYL